MEGFIVVASAEAISRIASNLSRRPFIAGKGRLTCSALCKLSYQQSFHCILNGSYALVSSHGRVNVLEGPREERMMTTGLHTVSDIYCKCCHQIVGWKYEKAYEKSQKYKEGKFILELARMVGGDCGEIFGEAQPIVNDADDV